jgi:6-phosphofructokinase 1
MGRDSGFIAAGATIASQDVNFTIIPEIPLVLEGEKGLLETLKRRILKRRHAVIAVAEGAGQDLLVNAGKDASGNVLHGDIGVFLKDKIVAYFKEQKIPVNMKYIDPSYIIRSVHANAEDSFLCDQYARGAVHAAMAGKTGLIIGLWNGFIHLPIPLATGKRQYLKPEGYLWNCVISSTGQPSRWS